MRSPSRPRADAAAHPRKNRIEAQQVDSITYGNYASLLYIQRMEARHKPKLAYALVLVMSAIALFLANRVLHMSISLAAVAAALVITMVFCSKIKLAETLSSDGFMYYKASVDTSVALTAVFCGLLIVQLVHRDSAIFFPALVAHLYPVEGNPGPIHRVIGALVTIISLLISVIAYLCAKVIRQRMINKIGKGIDKYRIFIFFLFSVNYMCYVVITASKL